jgi:hypothetical protein
VRASRLELLDDVRDRAADAGIVCNSREAISSSSGPGKASRLSAGCMKSNVEQ